MALFCATVGRDSSSFFYSFSFLTTSIFSRVRCCLLVAFKTSIVFFSFPFLFSGYCYSAGPRVVSIVSDCCNPSSSALFHAVFKSLYW